MSRQFKWYQKSHNKNGRFIQQEQNSCTEKVTKSNFFVISAHKNIFYTKQKLDLSTVIPCTYNINLYPLACE